jgi:hypothetical protein
MAKIFEICRCVRNTVHHESTRTVTVVNSSDQRTYVTLPHDEEQRLLALLGTDAVSWGIETLIGDKIWPDRRDVRGQASAGSR